MSDDHSKTVVYCSGPMFSPGELYEGKQVAKVFEDAGFDTYLPPRDGLEVKKIMALGQMGVPDAGIFKTLTDDVYKAIFALDVFQLVQRCDVLVFNMNGREADDGSIAETAMAYALGKPLVIYKQDPRSEFNGRDNPMLTGLGLSFATEADPEKLPDALRAVREKFDFPSTEQIMANLPAATRGAVEAGEAVWDIYSDFKKRLKEYTKTPPEEGPSTASGSANEGDAIGEIHSKLEMLSGFASQVLEDVDEDETKKLIDELKKIIAKLNLDVRDLAAVLIFLVVLLGHTGKVKVVLDYFKEYTLPN